jgi:hypothetical protein
MKKVLVWVGLGLVAAIIALLSIRAYLAGDEPPPNDADLRLARLNIPDDENAFTYFKLAGESAYEPEGQEWEMYDAMSYGEAWDPQLAGQIIEKNKEAFRYLDRGLGCSQMESPELRGESELLPLSRWRGTARLSSFYATALQKQGKHKEAFDQAVKTVRFGRTIQNGRAPIINYLVGMAIKAIGLKTTRRLLADTSLESAELGGYTEQLGACGPSPDALADCFRIDYMYTVRMLGDLAAGKPVDPESAIYIPGDLREARRIFAEITRDLVDNASKKHWQRAAPPVPQEPTGVFGAVKNALFGDTPADFLWRYYASSIYRIFDEDARTNADVSATRLLIALKCCKMETGKLPETLDALVPEYIGEIPEDDFDGRPMRYSRDEKLIYSVGKDMQDNGGDEGKDILFRIGF